MLSKERTDKEIADLLATNNVFTISIFGGGERVIELPEGYVLNVQLVEDYFHYLEEHAENNAWDYIVNWVSKYGQVYSVNTQEGYIDISVVKNPMKAYTGFSVFYARKEDAICHCNIFYETALRDYRAAISQIEGS